MQVLRTWNRCAENISYELFFYFFGFQVEKAVCNKVFAIPYAFPLLGLYSETKSFLQNDFLNIILHFVW
jgi:hypothetical protein